MPLISKLNPESQVTPTAAQFGQGGAQLRLRIGVKRGDIDDIAEPAACCFKHRDQIIEGQLILSGEIRFRCSVRAAADLPGYKQQVARPDRRRVSVLLEKIMPILGK